MPVVSEEAEAVSALAADFDTRIIGAINRCPEIQLADDMGVPFVDAFPDCAAVPQMHQLADAVLAECGGV